MTIKEIETRAGLPRANSRFYEAEGLLKPSRGSNGYRDYSEEDLDILLRVKLLRTLRFPLGEIKALQAGETELLAALDQRIRELEQEQKDAARSREVCGAMRRDRAEYATLNARHYLDELAQWSEKPAPVFSEDMIPKVRAPWRRFWARQLDLLLCTLVPLLVELVILRMNLAQAGTMLSVVNTVIELLLLVLVEPLLLKLFGTTPGKWIFGLSVTDLDGGKPDYALGMARTAGVVVYGLGLSIPIVSLWRLWKSFRACADGVGKLNWESETVLVLKDEKRRRYLSAALACVLVFGVLILAVKLSFLPGNRGGAITRTEFAENYNWLKEHHGVHTLYLDEQGCWTDTRQDGGNTVFVLDLRESPAPDFTYIEDGETGVLTGVVWDVHVENVENWLNSYSGELQLAELAFIQAQASYGVFDSLDDLLNLTYENAFREFTWSGYGVSVTYETEYSGLRAGEDILLQESTSNEFTLHFEMTLEPPQ